MAAQKDVNLMSYGNGILIDKIRIKENHHAILSLLGYWCQKYGFEGGVFSSPLNRLTVKKIISFSNSLEYFKKYTVNVIHI